MCDLFQALLQHGRLWPNFVQDYRELVTKIQTRYGIMKPSCRLDLREIKSFMDRKTGLSGIVFNLFPNDKF